MKIRVGFVSNSSSSSFCLIGVENEEDIKKLMEASGLMWDTNREYPTLVKKSSNSEVVSEDDVKHWGGYVEGDLVDFVMANYDPDSMIGAGIGTEILEKMTLPEARKYFAKLMKDELGVTINPKHVDIISGECSSGG